MGLRHLKTDLEIDLCKHTHFAHAIHGYDATSGVFGIGKCTTLKLISDISNVFSDECSSNIDIEQAGKTGFVALYGGGPNIDLNILYYERFSRKVATNATFVHPRFSPNFYSC